jgi:hypothetical protein
MQQEIRTANVSVFFPEDSQILNIVHARARGCLSSDGNSEPKDGIDDSKLKY